MDTNESLLISFILVPADGETAEVPEEVEEVEKGEKKKKKEEQEQEEWVSDEKSMIHSSCDKY